MKKYMLMYAGMMTSLVEMDKTQSQAMIGAWNQWCQSIGAALLDPGAPLVNGRALVDNGMEDEPLPIQGYAIVRADDIQQVMTLIQNHPFINREKKGEFDIEIYEIMDENSVPSVRPEGIDIIDRNAIPAPQPGIQEATVPEAPAGVIAPDIPSPQPAAAPSQDPGELSISHDAPEEPIGPVDPNGPGPNLPPVQPGQQ